MCATTLVEILDLALYTVGISVIKSLEYKEQARYEEAEKLFLEAVKGRRLKLGDTHPHTIESLNNLIALYETWNKPEKAKEWRTKLPKKEAKIE